MTFKEPQKNIQELRDKKYAGVGDWRLPTVEEAMSLMESKKNEIGLYIDPIFDKNQKRIWTADRRNASSVWAVGFLYGGCGNTSIDFNAYVRAVR